MLIPKNIVWHETTDVVVIGYGLAGAVTAITAHDKGAKVIMLEKQPVNAVYSCSALSGGVFICPTNYKEAAQYMTALCQMYPNVAWTDDETIEAWAKYTVQNKDWFENLGAMVSLTPAKAEHPQLPGSDCIQVWKIPGAGMGMMNLIYRTVENRNIRVLYETAAKRLLTNDQGEIIGIRVFTAKEPGKEINIRASKAVILCSGGFEFNEEMKLQYLRMYPVHFSAGIGNTGDGIKMAQEAGADLWHMNCVSARLVAKFPDFPLSMTLEFSNRTSEKSKYGFIIVNKYGRRYTSENIQMHGAFYELTAFDSHKLEYPRVPSYVIFDERRMKSGPLAWRASGASGPVQMYHWSLDNSTELEKGWIIKSDTPDELARKIGVETPVLKSSIETWNTYCGKGKDEAFGRKPEDLISLDAPPFYAVPLYPGGPNTQGGPRRNSKAQVITPFGDPIRGLYAAGECGSVYGMLYPAGGGNLAECIAFGRIAAENAVNEKPKASG